MGDDGGDKRVQHRANGFMVWRGGTPLPEPLNCLQGVVNRTWHKFVLGRPAPHTLHALRVLIDMSPTMTYRHELIANSLQCQRPKYRCGRATIKLAHDLQDGLDLPELPRRLTVLAILRLCMLDGAQE